MRWVLVFVLVVACSPATAPVLPAPHTTGGYRGGGFITSARAGIGRGQAGDFGPQRPPQ